jgi:hypothetical protein
VLAVYFFLHWLLPLGTAVQVGADEGFELSKAMLCLKGHKLYTEVWNDQPPLHTFLITQVVGWLGPSVLWPRLMTVGFGAVLVGALFLLIFRLSGLLAGAVAAFVVVGAPGFLTLSSSCMLEVPSLGTGVAALCILGLAPKSSWRLPELTAGMVFGGALQMKLVPAYLLPLAAIFLRARDYQAGAPVKQTIISLAIFGSSLAVTYIALDLLIERGAFLLNFGQAMSSHFGGPKSSEYGSAGEHSFDWAALVKNWDMTVPGVLGVVVTISENRRNLVAAIPVAWLALSLLVFGIHRPWWPYYYIHTVVPFAWCAGIGLGWMLRVVAGRRGQRGAEQGVAGEAGVHDGREGLSNRRRDERGERRGEGGSGDPGGKVEPPYVGCYRWWVTVPAGIFVVCAVAWASGRVYLQITTMRLSPQTYSEPVLGEIKRYEPLAGLLYAEQSVYSFHSGIPMPPRLAVVHLKRFWAGKMSNAEMAAELAAARPGLILLANDGRALPFDDLLRSGYRLTYMDGEHRLYVANGIRHRAVP